MDDIKIAQDLTKYAMQGIQAIESVAQLGDSLSKFFMQQLKTEATRKELLNFYNEGLKQEGKVKKGEELKIFSYTINPQYAKQLYEICKRDHISNVKVQLNTFDLEMDGKGDNIKTSQDCVWIYSTQQKQFNMAVAEAKARSGYEQEISFDLIKNLHIPVNQINNPVLGIKDMPLGDYLQLRQDIQKLPEEMRFTLFPKMKEIDGEKFVDVGFFSKTERKYDRRGIYYEDAKEYYIPDLVKTLILKQEELYHKGVGDELNQTLVDQDIFRQEMVKDILKNRSDTPYTIEKMLSRMSIDKATKDNIEVLLKSYLQKRENKDELYQKVFNIKNIPDEERKELLKSINRLGNAIYIVPATIDRDNGELNFQVSLKESICVGKEAVIRSASKEDLIIEDEESLEANLNRKLIEYTETGKADKNKEKTFMILTEEEFNGIENGDTRYVNFLNQLNNEQIQYLKREKKRIKKVYEKDISSLTDNTSVNYIDLLNEKREKFLLASDVNCIEENQRLSSYPSVTVETLINEQNINEGAKNELLGIVRSLDDFGITSIDEINDVMTDERQVAQEEKDIDDIEREEEAFDFNEELEPESGREDLYDEDLPR